MAINRCKNNKGQLVGIGLAAFAIEVVYIVITCFIHAPDFPTANIFSAEGNIVCYVDRMYYPNELLVNGLFYRCGLAYISSISMALLGVIMGIGFYNEQNKSLKEIVAIIGLMMMSCGYFLRTIYPINKRLWSPSFILFIAGIDIIILFFLNRFIDGKVGKHKNILESFGQNTIILYFLEGSGCFTQIGVFLFSFIFTIFGLESGFYEQLAGFIVVSIVAVYMANKNIKINV